MNEIKITKWASIYANPDFMCVTVESGYRSSAIDDVVKPIFLGSSPSVEGMGEAICGALAASRMLRPEELPGFFNLDAVLFRYKSWVESLLNAYNYKSKGVLFKKMMRCSVELSEGLITIKPLHHEKLEAWSRKGHVESDVLIVPESATYKEIGEAALTAINRCTGMGAYKPSLH